MSLDLIAEQMRRFGGQWLVFADEIEGPGVTVRFGSACGSVYPGHFDIDLMMDNGIVITDCALASGLHMWADTTAATVMDYVRQGFDNPHQGEDWMGFPGWRTVTSGVVGWGAGDDFAGVQQWALDRPLVRELAPILRSGLDRRSFNGINLHFGGREGFPVAEVRINGRLHEPSSQALLRMSWPRTVMGSNARAFVLLVAPKTAVSRTWRHRLKTAVSGAPW